jgi:hypothetical protein
MMTLLLFVHVDPARPSSGAAREQSGCQESRRFPVLASNQWDACIGGDLDLAALTDDPFTVPDPAGNEAVGAEVFQTEHVRRKA